MNIPGIGWLGWAGARPRNCLRDYVPSLAWIALGSVPQVEMESHWGEGCLGFSSGLVVFRTKLWVSGRRWRYLDDGIKYEVYRFPRFKWHKYSSIVERVWGRTLRWFFKCIVILFCFLERSWRYLQEETAVESIQGRQIGSMDIHTQRKDFSMRKGTQVSLIRKNNLAHVMEH